MANEAQMQACLAGIGPEGLFYEDIELGAEFVTSDHEITREGIATFGKVTLDEHPLHVDEDYARKAGFPGLIAHGLFGLSLMEGLKTRLHLYDQSSIASLGWDAVKFRAPILPGDRVHVWMKFSGARASSSRPAGIVTEEVELRRADGRVLISAQHLSFIRAKAETLAEGT
ncbi:MaoC family dehydratase (plasmid) [Thioclava sp. 'Guangxiensis']|uniref:MaoC family dehydratase n=1 Tax=Thioclava sp. 'Guangxiensis' TaxID=3149044 RepID=UPI0032C4763E